MEGLRLAIVTENVIDNEVCDLDNWEEMNVGERADSDHRQQDITLKKQIRIEKYRRKRCGER